MAFYKNTQNASSLAAVEFTPVSDGNFTFFYTTPDHKEELKKWLTTAAIGQEVVAETALNKQAVLVTHGDKHKDEMLKLLKEHGEKLVLHVPKKPFNFWLWRGALSMVGQPLQFMSGWSRKNFRDHSIIVFASLNMAANIVNWVFGAQKSEDEHRLNLVKNKINDELGEHMATLDEIIKINETRSDNRKELEQPKDLGQKFNEFMQRNSVTFGEIGLRYLGGVSLVAPMGRWAQGARILSKEKSLSAALAHIKNPDTKTFNAGMGWLTGKTLAFFAKTPDPYNPEPKTTLDNLRENYLFKISTLSEMAGSSYLAHDRFTNPKRRIVLHGKEYQDYLGGVGGLLFSLAFAMRLAAPYGVKELDMEEVYAHATDTLAKTTPDKLPQLLADTAASLKDHLKDKDIEFGEIFTKMMADLYRYHHIALDNLGNEPDERRTKFEETIKEAAVVATEEKTSPTAAPQSMLGRANISPAATHIEKISKTADADISLGMSA